MIYLGKPLIKLQLHSSTTYSYRTRILHIVSIFHNGNHATFVQNSHPRAVVCSIFIHRYTHGILLLYYIYIYPLAFNPKDPFQSIPKLEYNYYTCRVPAKYLPKTNYEYLPSSTCTVF